jgi:hypothetical protein
MLLKYRLNTVILLPIKAYAAYATILSLIAFDLNTSNWRNAQIGSRTYVICLLRIRSISESAAGSAIEMEEFLAEDILHTLPCTLTAELLLPHSVRSPRHSIKYLRLYYTSTSVWTTARLITVRAISRLQKDSHLKFVKDFYLGHIKVDPEHPRNNVIETLSMLILKMTTLHSFT